jgi:hypothetical protein
VTAVLLLTPDVLWVATFALRRGNPRLLVARRLMQSDRGRQSVAVLLVACCVALPIFAGTQLASKKASDATFTYGYVPAGQMWVENQGGTGDVRAVARVVSAAPGASRPVVVRELASGPPARSETAFFRNEPSGTKFTNGTIMVLDSATDLRRLLGDELPARTEARLEAGGVVDFTGARGDQRFVVTSSDGGQRLTASVPTLKVTADRQYTTSFGGAILRSTAGRLGLPVGDPTKYLYPDVSEQTIRKSVSAVVDAGYDSEFVLYAVPPPPPDLPTSGYVFLSCLMAGCFAVLLIVVRGQVRRLRAYSARLVAIGLTPRWVLSLLGIQSGLLIGTGLLGGAAAGVVGLAAAADSYAVVDVPVAAIAGACVATVVMATAATAAGIRSLRADASPVVG